MKLRKKTLALTMFSFAFTCIVATSAYVLNEQGVFDRLTDDKITKPVTQVEKIAGTGMYPVTDENGKWGFMNSQGEIIIDCEYQDAKQPMGSGVWVKNDNYWGMLDLDGNTLVDFNFSDLKTVSQKDNTYFIAIGDKNMQDANHSSFYDTKGNKIFGIAGELHELSNGLMAFSRIKDDTETWGYINTSGQIVVEPTYALAGSADKKFALVKDQNNQKFLLDLITLKTTKLEADVAIGALSDGLILHENADGKYGYLDTDQNLAIDYQFLDAKTFENGLAIVETKTGAGLIDTTGKFIVEPKYAEIRNLDKGYYQLCIKDETGSYITNAQGEFILDENLSAEKFYQVGNWLDGTMSVVTDDATRFISATSGLLPHPILEMQSGVSMLDNLYQITDDNGMTYFNDEIVIYSVGREKQLAKGIKLHTITLNEDANYLVNYPEIEVDEEVATDVNINTWNTLNQNFLKNVKSSYLAGLYDNEDNVNYNVNGNFKYTECGNTMSVIQTLAITDPWYENWDTEYDINTISFNKNTGEQYLLSSLFKKEVDWRRELLESAKVGYTAYSAGKGLDENPEILDFLDEALPYNVMFTLAVDSLTLYVPLSNGNFGIVPIYYQDFEQLINQDGSMWQDIKATEVDLSKK